MAEVVEYEMSLKDMLTGKVKQADTAVNKLEGSMHSLGQRALHVAEAFGISFAMFKGIEFVHEGIEAYEKLHQAEAQVEAGLKSTGFAAGVTADELEASAIRMAASVKYSRAEITQLQSIMVTFPAITKDVFEEAQTAMVDMSARLGQDLQSSAIQLGKALQDPERGITALRRVGVNFNETQTEMVKRMVATGHQAQAQAYILKELKTEFGGSALAAAEADPLFKFNKLMNSLKMAVGETAITLLHDLTPALEYIGNLMKRTGEFIKNNIILFKTLGVAIGIAAAAYGIYRAVLFAGIAVQAVQTAWTYIQIAAMYSLGTAYEGTTIATQLLAAAQWALNAAWAANPIGVIILALAAVGAAIYAAYQKVAWFRAGLWATWAVLKEGASIIVDVFSGLHTTIQGMLQFDPKMMAEGMARTIGAVRDAATRIGKAAKEGYEAGMEDFNKSQHNAAAPKDAKKNLKPAALAQSVTPEAKGAKGQKNITITVNISNLVKELKISTTNMLESSAKIREMVTEALTSAVNDSQRVAGQ
jgi:hypothetical protein